MKGQIIITKALVESLDVSYIDAFKGCLKTITKNPCAGWHAMKETETQYEFLWSEPNDLPSDKDLRKLKSEGYYIPYNID